MTSLRALIGTSRWLALAALLPLSAACFVDVSLDGKACGEGHDCGAGYACVEGRCVEGSGAPLVDAGELDGGPPGDDSGSPGEDDAGLDAGPGEDLDAGHDAGPEDGGPIDGGDDAGDDDGGAPLDAGVDGGDEDGGLLDGGADGGLRDAGPDGGSFEEMFGDGRDGPLEVTSSFSPNVCRPLLSSTTSSVVLSSSTGIAVGARLLLWQVQDTFATVADESPVHDAGRAGWLTLVRVTSRQGNRLYTDPPPEGRFETDSDASAQACVVPEHTSVVVRGGAALTAEAWSGSAGGVVAILASERVTLEAGGRIDASERGFRGGVADPGSNDADHVTDEITDREQGGQKGEGLDPTAVGLYGRGNYANGGGGGNAHNGGGGGGGNGGAGGRGGFEWGEESDPPNLETGGRPGAAVESPIITLGGGGGAGEIHHSSGSNGGAGGGLVIVFTPRLEGAGTIAANGGSAPYIDEAGSGGGAGGTIVLLPLDASAFTGLVEARGGDGGSAGEGLGPGGGGGGGVIRSLGFLPNVDVSGGAGGLADGDARGAEPGAEGVVESPAGS